MNVELPAELYPFRGKFRDRDGLAYHYLDEGEGDPVVMVHGNPTWSLFFRRLVTELRPDHRCIVPDHIGMGLSDKPGDDRYRYTLQSRIDDLGALIAELGLRRPLTLILHDWGGAIGMGHAVRHPETIGRIVLLNTAAFHLPPTMALPTRLKLSRLPGLGPLMVGGLNAFARAATRLCCTRRPMSAPLRRAYLAPYDRPAHRIGVVRFVEDIPLRPVDPAYHVMTGIEAGLGLFADRPRLICWGDKDFVFTPAVLAEWRRRWPDAEVHRFADCGHYLLEDAGDEVAARVRNFIARHPLP